MCNNTVHRPTASFNGIVDPFSFSTLHLLRTCNRLMLPTDMRNYYTIFKDSNNNNNSSIETEKSLTKSPVTSLKILELTPQPTTEYNSIFPSVIYPKEISPLISNVTSSACSPSGFEFSSSSDYSGNSSQLISDFSYNGVLSRRQRGEKRAIPNEQKDEKYFERRKRNNEAAKKSRDARKLREDRIAFRAALLEQENAILRAQMLAMRDEMNTLRQVIGRA